MAAAAKPAKPAYELSGWERFKKDVFHVQCRAET